MDSKSHYLNLVWQQRIHVEPDALEELPAVIQQRYESVWDLSQQLVHILALLPTGMLRWWLSRPAGYIVIRRKDSALAVGSQVWRGNSYSCLLYLAAVQLAEDAQGSFELVMRLFDLLLGSPVPDPAALFSAGCGATPELAAAAQRLVRLAQLGYSSEAESADSNADFFARTIYLALNVSQELNRQDPLLLKLYRQTLLSDAFWKRQLAGRQLTP